MDGTNGPTVPVVPSMDGSCRDLEWDKPPVWLCRNMWRAFPWIERPRNSKQKKSEVVLSTSYTTTSYQWAGWVMVWSFEVWCTLWSFLFFSLLFGQVAGSFFPGRNNLIMACQAPVATFSCTNVHHNCVLTIDDRLTETVVNFDQKFGQNSVNFQSFYQQLVAWP